MSDFICSINAFTACWQDTVAASRQVVLVLLETSALSDSATNKIYAFDVFSGCTDVAVLVLLS
jgi:hypothetical protein